jgi:hypothetical protein
MKQEWRDWSDGSGTVLHNMSAPAKTVIRRAAGSQRIGHGEVFELPASQSAEPADLIAALGLSPPADRALAEQQLREIVQAHAPMLRLPAASVLHDRACPDDRICECLRSILTVLSKSSGNVYLRDKEPNLNAIAPGRRVIVIVPPNWRPA